MALAETVLRAVHKYHLVRKFSRILPIVSFLFALSSIIWLLVLPIDGNYRRTYISENALMPSQVTSYFRESEWNIVRGYREELKKYVDAPIEQRNQVIENWLIEGGLKTNYHNDSSNDFPASLYGIMHASRGEDTEAMVLAVPWVTSDNKYNLGGAALAIALSRYFNRMSIWSKNIIVVFTQDSHKSLRSWVEAYHSSLDKTAGAIEAAIILEYTGESDYFDYFEMWYEGLNGQLPNLDFLNTVAHIGYHENIHVSIQGTPGELVTLNTYLQRLKVFVKGIIGLTLAGILKPINGAESFSGWSIQACTIKARGIKGPNDITQFGRVVDSSFRSVNNLLEKFHQSFFFYLLLGPRFFVSIGTYLPSAVLISISYALSSLSCLLSGNVSILSFLLNIQNLLIFFTAIEFFCYLLSNLIPFLMNQVSAPDDKAIIVNLVIVFFTVLSITLSTSSFWKKKFLKLTKLSITGTMGYSIISFNLFFISMVIIMLLILNFSLALIIGVAALPLTFVQPIIKTIELNNIKAQLSSSDKEGSQIPRFPLLSLIESYKPQLKLLLCLFISNPIFLILITGGMYVNDDNGVYNLMSSLITSWDDLQCWTWYIIMLGWFPAWLNIGLSCLLGDFEAITPEKKIE